MKILSRNLILALTIVLVCLFSGCGSSGSDVSNNSSDSTTGTNSAANDTKGSTDSASMKIGLSLPTQREERWVHDRDTMESEAKNSGIDLRVMVADNDPQKQDSQCDNLITQGISVLILAPQDAKSAASIVDKAHKAGIKVISYDRLVTDTDVDVYLSFDNVKVGELQGEYITKLVPKGNYVVLSGAPTDNNAKLFKQGAMKFIKPLADKGDIKIITEEAIKDWQPSEALKIMENTLSTNSDIQAILAPNDGTAGGCIQALAAKKLEGKIPITGQDSEVPAAHRIVQGTQTMTIFKDTRLLGKEAIKLAIQMCKGKAIDSTQKVNNNKIDVPSVLLTPVVVDKSNIDKILIDSGYMKKEQVYVK